MDVARQVPGRGALRLLGCDREFCDGTTITRWKRQGIDVVLPLKTDMDAYADAVALSRLLETVWKALPVAPEERAKIRGRQAAPDSRNPELACV